MTDLIQCPHCQAGFLMPPAPCPSCGVRVEALPTAPGPRGADRVVTSRLNQTAAVGGVMLAGLITGAVSWFTFSREMGTALLLAALLVSAAILWRR
jgi:hypothetical protein